VNLPDLTPYDPADPVPGLRNRVARGVAFFDAQMPGWRDHVDPVALDLESCQWCIRGQLLAWLERADPTEEARITTLINSVERQRVTLYPPSLGLESPAAFELNLGGGQHDDYTILTRLWREHITREPFAGWLDGGCRYVFEGPDDGLEMWRCTTHDDVSIGFEVECATASDARMPS